MKLSEAKRFLSDNKIKFILAQFVDIHGVAKTKAVPAGHLEDIVTDGAGFAGFASLESVFSSFSWRACSRS